MKVFLAAAIASGIAIVSAQTSFAQPASAQLKALLDDDLAAVFRAMPLVATVRGIPGYDHLLPDRSFATLEKEKARARSMLARLKAIDPKERIPAEGAAGGGAGRVAWRCRVLRVPDPYRHRA